MYFQGDIDAIVKRAKKKAKDVFYGTDQTLESDLLRLRFVIARHWGIPLFSKYFDERTIEDLIFEAEMIYLSNMPEDQKTSDIVKDMRESQDKGKKTELDSLFDDMVEDEKSRKPGKKKAWVNWSDAPSSSPMSNEELDAIEKQFFESGDFLGDK